MTPLNCGNCHQPIPSSVHPYTFRIELFPRVEESLQFIESDLDIDCNEEIKKIIEGLEAMSEDEVHLEEERIYSTFSFVICPSCRDKLAAQLRHNALHPEPPEP